MENKVIDKLLELLSENKENKISTEKLNKVIAKYEQEKNELENKLKEKELNETNLKKELDEAKNIKEEELKKVETLLKESVQETNDEVVELNLLDGFDGVVETENEFINE